MSSSTKILAFAGSTREGSFNKRLISIGADAVRAAGAEVTLLDLRDIPMPFYDGDCEQEQGLPPNGRKFKDILLAHDALLISAPEYNSSISGVLKNAIDWASRPVPGEPSLACFTGKVAGLLSASPGALGGLRGLMVLRLLLSNIGVIVLPEQFALAKANEAFDEKGALKDAKQKSTVDNIATRLVTVTSKLKQR